MALFSKLPDIVRFSPIRADSAAIFYAYEPNAYASTPIALDFVPKLNDW